MLVYDKKDSHTSQSHQTPAQLSVSRCHTGGKSEDHTGEKAHKQEIDPGFQNPGQTLPEIQNRGISGPTKRTCDLHFF